MVAQRHGVVQPAEGDRVVEGTLAGQRDPEFLGGQEVVTRSQGYHAVAGRLSSRLHRLQLGGEAGDPGEPGTAATMDRMARMAKRAIFCSGRMLVIVFAS